MLKYTTIFLCIILIKFLMNASKLLSMKRVRDRYTASFAKDGPLFTELIPKAKKLLADAELDSMSISVAQPLGCSLVSSSQARITDNLDSRRADIVSSALSLMDQAVGVFRMRMWESFSPQYWIEAVIFLPKHIFQFLGGRPDSFPAKLFQILYWALAPLLLAFRSDFYQYIADLIRNL